MNYYSKLLEKYRNKGIIIDTNILLLLFIGDYKKELITRFKRTNKYTIKDYENLKRTLSIFSKTLTSSHILTETSNLIKYSNNSTFSSEFEIFASQLQIYNKNNYLIENSTISKNLDHKIISKFGLTDAAIYDLSKNNLLVLTDDLPLYHYLANNEIDVINFNHLRLLKL